MSNNNSFNILKKKTHIKLITALLIFFVVLIALVGLGFLNNYFSTQADQTLENERLYLPEIKYSETDFQLKITKLGINVPIIKDVDGADKTAYFKALEGGVAHMAGTSTPDQEGNVVIFGHSSFYAGSAGDFKEIFAVLDRLEEGDKITVHYKGEDYKYQVENSQIVAPEDVWILTADYDLTLLTCWPPGSIDKRLVVFANKIY